MSLEFYRVDRDLAQTVRRPHVYKDNQGERTLLLLHGTGADEHDLLGIGRLIDPSANLLSPRGLVVHHGMARHFLRHDNGEFDEAGIEANSEDLAKFVVAAAKEYGFDIENVWGVGFSNGATALNAMLLQQPQSLRGIFAFGTTRPFRNAQHVDLSGKYVFLANGAQDTYSPANEVAELVETFESAGAEVKLLVHPGGHTIVAEHVREFASDLLGIEL